MDGQKLRPLHQHNSSPLGRRLPPTSLCLQARLHRGSHHLVALLARGPGLHCHLTVVDLLFVWLSKQPRPTEKLSLLTEIAYCFPLRPTAFPCQERAFSTEAAQPAREQD